MRRTSRSLLRARGWARRGAAGLLLLAACASEGASEGESGPMTQGCDVRQRMTPLPAEILESSGLAASRVAPGVFWTHNDSGGDAAVYAVGLDGAVVGKVEVEGARNRDWEDLAIGPCATGSCLYIADTGDNSGRRDDVDVYVAPEPDPRAPGPVRAERYRIRYPVGSRDSEAMFVLPSGEIFLVTKGRREAVEVFRYPLPLRADQTVELERVAALTSARPGELLQVTAADASPDGRWVAVRAYRALLLFRPEELLAGKTEPALLVDLSPVGEAQGEAVALGDDGTVTLSSEGDRDSGPATLAQLACQLPG